MVLVTLFLTRPSDFPTDHGRGVTEDNNSSKQAPLEDISRYRVLRKNDRQAHATLAQASEEVETAARGEDRN